ncbi:MAG: hypothetical protein K6G61_03360 [Solobacterium sp.]|nr:hypothetical protein [Solobacterium sp.]
MYTNQDLIQYIRRFVRVTLSDGTVVSGYVSNRDDLKSEDASKIVLINGLMHSEINISSIIDIESAERTENTRIPLVDTEQLDLARIRQLDEKIDELFNQSLSDEIVAELPDGRRLRRADPDD